ncbi:DUF4132 domain-containing protein [Actinosynnema mirum]|uniref:WGR domain-containing protein n=1 Tax=Actinosynnema mirum (strain ATCC 29888 / DSM 43827 / JCM 3225 / NBRC 14064 / NCIMB 13271 / NRRL B-12336 / IMRU 3971 / 101) TaxID=446462 RepID=C6WE93_ACTMD|nr:DUF4132 domain-containing protein [Actinosynnema mirum]ACU35836.1 WGR domain-containing protein [Actinosynnema mirum DSM 43827]
MGTAGGVIGEFRLPPGVRGEAHPRRGGRTRPEVVAAGGVAAGRVDRREELPPQARWALHATAPSEGSWASRVNGSAPELVEAANAHLDGDRNPLGAAVVACLLGDEATPDLDGPVAAWVDAHGLVFAAQAVVELAGIVVLRYQDGDGVPRRAVRRRVSQDAVARGVVGGRLVRSLLAVCPDDVHAEVVAALAGLRGSPVGRLAVSYLVPTEAAWVEEVVTEVLAGPRHSPDGRVVLLSVGAVDQLQRLLRLEWVLWHVTTPEVLHTALDVMGHDLLPVLERLLELPLRGHEAVLDVIASMPGDGPFQFLLPRIKQRYARSALMGLSLRDPERALRLLDAETAGRPSTSEAARLLRALVVRFRDVDPTEVPERVRAALERVRAAHRGVPEAGVDELPRVLVSPPWEVKRRPAEPEVVPGVEPPAGRALVWEPGERETWSAVGAGVRTPAEWAALVRDYRAGELRWRHEEPPLFVGGPEDEVRPLLADWTPDPRGAERWGRPLVARFGLEALPQALALARARPATLAELVLPCATPEVAGLVADWLVRVRSARPVARRWLERHGLVAARLLVPVAVGPAGARRRAAENALRQTPEHAMTAARERGERVASVVAAALAVDPLDVLPARVPAVPAWLDEDALPQLLLRGGERALPPRAARNVLVVLALSTPDEPYAGLDQVRRACDPTSLARFAQEVFELWRLSGMPAKEGWALTGLGLVGDDEVVRELSPLIRMWPAEGGHARAATALDVLARLGTDVALLHLGDLARRVRHKGVRTGAQARLDEVATSRGLTPEQLADRLVPDFGLSPEGSLVLDYGPRRFTVGFDEQLTPHVTGPDGKRLKSLPKPGARDDRVLAPEAQRRFAALKKDVRTAAVGQIARLEQAMLAGRTWSAEEFTALFAHHPLVWHLARRLVWITESGLAFRLAEDRTLGDLNESPVVLGPDERVALAHPMGLGDDLEAWAELLADYEVLQPFPQLGRPVHRLTAEEAGATALVRFHDRVAPHGKVLGLLRKGWEHDGLGNGGVIDRVRRPLPDGRAVVVGLDPGVDRDHDPAQDEQRITEVRLADHSPTAEGERVHRFGTADPVALSEALGDLDGLIR